MTCTRKAVAVLCVWCALASPGSPADSGGMGPLEHSARFPPMAGPGLNATSLAAISQRLLPRFHHRCLSEEVGPYLGILPSELLALLSAMVATQVEIMIEAGTCKGETAAMIARFFKGSGVEFYTIDNDFLQYEQKSGWLSLAQKRLRAINGTDGIVRMLRGDALIEIPPLLRRHRGRRIGIFMDGPPVDKAVLLCMKYMRVSLEFCAFHDMATWWNSSAGRFRDWDRIALLTDRRYWRRRFGALDSRHVLLNLSMPVELRESLLGISLSDYPHHHHLLRYGAGLAIAT